MFSKNRIFLAALVMAILMAGITVAYAGQSSKSPIRNLNLTEEQLNALRGVIGELNTKQFKIITDIEHKYLELELELKKEGRFETKKKEKISVQKANKLVKDISLLYGQLLRTTVEYLLKAKDVLTEEQKDQMISSLLDFELEVPDDLTYYLELDLLDLGLDLSNEQIKKILRYRTDMKVKELELELEVDYKILDLEIEITEDKVNPQRINQIIMDITDLGIKFIDNRVDHFVKTKDVLTVTQKEKLLHFILMTR